MMSRPRAPATTAPNKGASNGDPCSSSTLLDPECSSTLRARLRSQDPVLELSSASKRSEDSGAEVFRRFRECFASIPTSLTSGTDAPVEARGKAHAQLGEAFAEAGLRFYASVAEEIVQARGDIDSQIATLSDESAAVLSRANALYSNIAYPLSATLCHTDGIPTATMAAHLSALRGKLSAAQDELQALQGEWEKCVGEEQQAWSELKAVDAERECLVSDDGGDAVAHEMEQFRDEVENLIRANEEVLDEIDAEFKESMQGETMRMMQSMMAG